MADSDPGAVPSRVALIGEHPDVDDWERMLRGRSSVFRGLPGAGEPADLLLAFGESGSVLDAISPPQEADVALVLSRDGRSHRLTGLIRALGRAKAAWEATFDSLGDPVALVESDGRVARANAAFARLLRQPVQALIGTGFASLVGSPESGTDPVAECLATGEPHEAQVRYSRLEGACDVVAVPMPSGPSATALVVLRDVERARERREALLRAARLADVGQLAGGIAHEINTPLASISLRAESLARAAKDPRLAEIESFRNFPRYLETIQQEVFRCKRIISALVDFARSPAPEVRPCDLNALCGRAADLLGHELKVRGATLDLELAPELPRIPADEPRLTQAVVALLMNARDAVAAGGRITLTTRLAGDDAVEIVVGDDGEGIAAEDLERIFVPFFTTRPTGHGTGLGLSTCHAVVTAHHGRISVESSPAHGARFTLRLPVAVPARPAP